MGFKTPLDFVNDAICLSGLTGTKLKCNVIGEYYPFWWRIVSGGPSKKHRFNTAIVELDAATGEVYIKDTGETVLGSAGHALRLKVTDHPSTRNLKIILVEKHAGCYSHLKNVIRRRWSRIPIQELEGPVNKNIANIYLFNKNLDEALDITKNLNLGNSLFFFDPLRGVEYITIEKVARNRIHGFYQTGTEFIIFLFTSDWFLGRDEFSPLPSDPNPKNWSKEEKETVEEADSLFGNKEWRKYLLTKDPIKRKEDKLVDLYKERLRKWFRYILPLPFNPKNEQIFHVILCSNFETGVRATRNFYALKTANPKYSPHNPLAYQKFIELYPKTLANLSRRRRKPPQWLVLWRIITQHEDGISDSFCSDLLKIESYPSRLEKLLKWLKNKGFLTLLGVQNAWDAPIQQYKLNWKTVKKKLGVDPPLPLKPVSPEQMTK